MAKSRSQRGSQSRQEAFIDRFSDLAIAAAQVSGVAPEVVLGQSALETGWGKSIAGGNMFGIKGKGQSVVTHEDIPGVGMVKSVESFRAYDNPLDSFMDYGNLMNTNRYSGIGPNQTVGQQIASIGKSGYATDRNYASKLASVVDRIQESKVFQDRVVTSVASLTPAPPDFFNDVGIPTGIVDFAGDLPDLTPASEAGFSWDLAGATLPDDFSLDLGPDVLDGPIDYSGMSSLAPMGAYSPDALGPMQGFTSPDASALFGGSPIGTSQALDTGWSPGFEGFNAPGMIDQASFDARYGDAVPERSIDTSYPQAEMSIASPGPLGMGEAFGIEASPWSDSGFVAGVDAGPYGATPDFSAPSLDARNAMDRAQGTLQGAALGMGYHSSDLNNEAIADRINAELSSPQLATPSFDMQAAYAGDWADKMGTPQLSAPSATPMASAPVAAAPKASARAMGDVSLPSLGPAVDIPSAPAIAAAPGAPVVSGKAAASTPSAPSFTDSVLDGLGLSGPVNDVKSSLSDVLGDSTGYTVGGRPGGFMDAMSNPTIAASYNPGLLDGWTGNVLSGAAMGGLTGGLPGAVMGGLWGGLNIGGNLSNLFGSANGFMGVGGFFDAMANPYAGLSAEDLAAFARSSERGARAPSGHDASGNATRGDGSYSEQSGYNDNSPQGII